MTPFWPVSDTPLAACLATLGIELDPTQPFSRSVDTASGKECTFFWMRDRSTTDPQRRTDEHIAAWGERAKFEAQHPAHPLSFMRAAIDARSELVGIIKGGGIQGKPVAWAGARHVTPSLREASILRAHGFPLLLFTGRAFAFPSACTHQDAREILDRAGRPEGATPAQWMHRVLVNLDKLLVFAKASDTRLLTRDGDRTLSLSVDAPKKTQDRFYALLEDPPE
jgi:hypothetical protein